MVNREAHIDGDVIKYAVGFACQRNCWKFTDLDTGEVIYDLKIGKSKEGVGIDSYNYLSDSTLNFPDSRKIVDVVDNTTEYLSGKGRNFEVQKYIRVDELSHVLHSVKIMVDSIIKRSRSTSYTMHLSKGECYRHKYFPLYKASRKDTPKPLMYEEIEKYLIERYDAQVNTDIEADDAMGIAQMVAIRDGRVEESIICTIDKDLDCIPGWHYNWNKKKLYLVSDDEADTNFWCQVLTGDKVDDIPGIKGVGPAKARKLIEDWKTNIVTEELGLLEMCKDEYELSGQFEDPKATCLQTCRLVWILQDPLEVTYPGGLK